MAETMPRDLIVAAREGALHFLSRCQIALTVAQQVGAPDWKIEALKEAVREAEEAAQDFARVLAE